MRVAAIYDIHGNLPALEAVLREVREAAVDHVVVGGDVVPGPMPKETLARLLELPFSTQFIYGNCEIAVLDEMAGRVPAIPQHLRPIIRWTGEQLADYQPLFAAWPQTLRMEIAGLGRVLFCHATPRNENEIFTRLTTEDRLLPVFENADADLVVCGHTHMQFDRMIGRTRVVNVGSVGMPFGEAGADWLLLGPGVELRHTVYNFKEAEDRIRSSDYPDAGNFIAHNLAHPPVEKEMLEAFAQVELK